MGCLCVVVVVDWIRFKPIQIRFKSESGGGLWWLAVLAWWGGKNVCFCLIKERREEKKNDYGKENRAEKEKGEVEKKRFFF